MNVFDKFFNSIQDELYLNEMAVAQVSNKDFLSLIKKGEYEKALDHYLKAGAAIGGRAQPRRTMTAWKSYIEKKDPRYNGITKEAIDKFEELLMKKHLERKDEEKSGKSLDKEPEEKIEDEPEVKPSVKDEIMKNLEGAKTYDAHNPEQKNTKFKTDAEYAKMNAEKAAHAHDMPEKAKQGLIDKATKDLAILKTKEEAREKIKTDKAFAQYIASFPATIANRYLRYILKDYENGYLIPKYERDDEEGIALSFKVHNPFGDEKSLQRHRVADQEGTRSARERVKLKELKGKPDDDKEYEKKSSIIGPKRTLIGDDNSDKEFDDALTDIKKNKLGHVSATRKGTASIYDKFGYPKENKETPEIERQIKELVSKASLEAPTLNDNPEIRVQKEKKVIAYAEKILALKKIHVFSTDDGVKAKMPDNSDELYPLARSLYSYKNGKHPGDFRKLILGIKRIGTHSPEVVRGKVIERLNNEMNVGITELNSLVKEDDVDKLKEIAKDIVKMYDYTKAKKPSLKQFREKFDTEGTDTNTFEAYGNIDYLYKVVYGAIKDASAKDIRDKIVAIKKGGLGNLVDLKAAGEKPSKAMDTWERDNKALSDKLR